MSQKHTIDELEIKDVKKAKIIERKIVDASDVFGNTEKIFEMLSSEEGLNNLLNFFPTNTTADPCTFYAILNFFTRVRDQNGKVYTHIVKGGVPDESLKKAFMEIAKDIEPHRNQVHSCGNYSRIFSEFIGFDYKPLERSTDKEASEIHATANLACDKDGNPTEETFLDVVRRKLNNKQLPLVKPSDVKNIKHLRECILALDYPIDGYQNLSRNFIAWVLFELHFEANGKDLMEEIKKVAEKNYSFGKDTKAYPSCFLPNYKGWECYVQI